MTVKIPKKILEEIDIKTDNLLSPWSQLIYEHGRASTECDQGGVGGARTCTGYLVFKGGLSKLILWKNVIKKFFLGGEGG